MTRSARNTSLETRTARTRLRIRRTPYFAKIAKGLRLGYYRGAVAGSWIAGHYRGNGVYATEAIGAADDTLEADGVSIFFIGRRRNAPGVGPTVSDRSRRVGFVMVLIRSRTLSKTI